MSGELDVRQYGRILRIPSPTGFSVGDINSYVILPPTGSDQLVLIDTGVGREDAWQALSAGLARVGYRIEDIRLVLLTHGHTDHFGQATRIREVSGCEVWGHEAIDMTVSRYLPSGEDEARERAFLRRLGLSDDLYNRAYAYRAYIADVYKPCAPDRLLADGDRVPIEDFALETIHTPGHCPEEVVYWQPETRQLFSGDHLLPDITPVCLMHIPRRPDQPRIHALSQYYESADKLLPLPVRAVYPSHGDVFHDHRELIAGYKLSTERRLLKIARILEREGELTPLEVGRQLFPKAWEDQLYAVISEVMGHLDLLLDHGFVAAGERGGLLYYRLLRVPGPGEIFADAACG
jgi:glyoxylase-like metal-dependent hydrolase (beta-lactamase superfamily II)